MNNDNPKPQIEIVKAQQRWVIKPHTSGADDLGYSYEALSHHMNDKSMMPFLVNIPSSQGRSMTPSTHDGEEFLFVMMGEIHAQINGEDYTLKKGDSLYFDPQLQHNFINQSSKPAQLLVCLINKSLDSQNDDPLSGDMEKIYE